MGELFQIFYALTRTSLRDVQEQVIMLWRDYLQECEGKVFSADINIISSL